MIPKIIHYCWFGQGEMSPLYLACIESWKKHLPEYKFIKWDEANCPKNEFIEYHLKENNWAFVSDYVRLHALYEVGGIYLDTDFEVIKSFDGLLDNNAFLAYEAEGRATNGIAGSIKGNIFFEDCMDYMIKRFDEKLSYDISPVVTTSVLESKNYDVTVFESQFFYPYNPYDESKDIKILMYCMVTEDTYAIHHWAKSWEIKKSKFENTIQLGWGAFSHKQWYKTLAYGLQGIVRSPFKDDGYRLVFCSFFRRG